MASASVQFHVHSDDQFDTRTTAYHVGEPIEFHTLKLESFNNFDMTLFFHDKAQMLTALNDLRLTCENKIWELSGMPEYEYSDEPF